MHIKYPRTEHLEGSKYIDLSSKIFQYNDKEQISFESLSKAGEYIILEEKMDGIGLGVGFIKGEYYIQHRGHIYSSTDTEVPYFIKNFSNWIIQHEELLYTLLEDKYCLFGEWLQYKHTIFYNSLSSVFLEYDIYSKEENVFLSTPKRKNLLEPFPEIQSVCVLDTVEKINLKELISLYNSIDFSIGKNNHWKKDLYNICMQKSLNYEEVLKHTLQDNLFEGFYIKTENENEVTGRYKWIRKEFLDKILNGEHWKKSPIIENMISSDISLNNKIKI